MFSKCHCHSWRQQVKLPTFYRALRLRHFSLLMTGQVTDAFLLGWQTIQWQDMVIAPDNKVHVHLLTTLLELAPTQATLNIIFRQRPCSWLYISNVQRCLLVVILWDCMQTIQKLFQRILIICVYTVYTVAWLSTTLNSDFWGTAVIFWLLRRTL